MSAKGFSINIDSFPITDGLGPVDQESSQESSQASAQKQPPQPAIRRGTGSLRGSRPNEITGSSRGTIPFPTMDGTASPSRATAMSQVMGSPRRNSSPFSGSPNRAALRSASPRHLSPATSQIFERDVQESTITAELSDAIPSHIQTEDHIPAVLEASSLAITDKRLNPSDVEIVMHATHQPASVNVAAATESQQSTGFASLGGELSSGMSQQDHMSDDSTTNPNYGTVDPLDPRRLSFISFADVVHAEHENLFNNQSLSHGGSGARAPSPSLGARSQAPHSHASHSGYTGSMLSTVEAASPLRRGSASIASPHAQTHGDLTIETMQQALEQPLTAVSAVDSGGSGRAGR